MLRMSYEGIITVEADKRGGQPCDATRLSPKRIWLRLGNCTTADVEALIRAKYPLIAELQGSAGRDILALFKR
ncbi:MAG TPA: hypothetical protein VGF69_05550 [Thermoanaerobaculia bacterium]|jgi:predicted nuclease of predicted toxin-antitoxin system